MKKISLSIYSFSFLTVTLASLVLPGCGDKHFILRQGALAPSLLTSAQKSATGAGDTQPVTTPPVDNSSDNSSSNSPLPNTGTGSHDSAQQQPFVPTQQAHKKSSPSTKLPVAKELRFTADDTKISARLLKIAVTAQGGKAAVSLQLKFNDQIIDLITSHDLLNHHEVFDIKTFPAISDSFQVRTIAQCALKHPVYEKGSHNKLNKCDNYIMIVQITKDRFLSSLRGTLLLREFGLVVSPKKQFKSGILVLNTKNPDALPTTEFYKQLRKTIGL